MNRSNFYQNLLHNCIVFVVTVLMTVTNVLAAPCSLKTGENSFRNTGEVTPEVAGKLQNINSSGAGCCARSAISAYKYLEGGEEWYEPITTETIPAGEEMIEPTEVVNELNTVIGTDGAVQLETGLQVNSLDQAIANTPPGTHVIVGYTWEDVATGVESGHALNIVNTNSGIRVIDMQTSTTFGESITDNLHEYFSNLATNSQASLKIDDLSIVGSNYDITSYFSDLPKLPRGTGTTYFP